MKDRKIRKRLRTIAIWLAWIVFAQFILINISAALYAHRLTYLYTPTADTWTKPASSNIFAKTWRLFTGPRYYHPPAKVEEPAFPFSVVRMVTAQEIPIEAWYSKTDSTAKGTVILFGGLMSNKGQLIPQATVFRNAGYNIMLVDVRGHGNSGGSVITIGYRESEEVKIAYDSIVQKGEKNIILWGASMGAVEIIKAVSDHKLNPAGIIVEMPFLSLRSHLKGRARILGMPEEPFSLLTSFWIGVERGFNGWKFQASRFAKNVHCPVLMQYGKKDQLVKQYETDEIFRSIASENKKLVIYEQAGHQPLLLQDPGTWKREIGRFLEQTGGSID